MPDSAKTILLVEDQALIALAQAATLRKYGFEVMNAYRGEEAIALCADHPEIDLVLMDVNLGPGIDGIQAAQAILARRDLPVIFLSSHTEAEVVEKTQGVTSYGYIVKSAGEAVMIATIRMAFRLFEARQREQTKDANLHAVLDAASDAVFLLSAEMQVLELNTAAAQRFSKPREELIGRSVWEIFPPDVNQARLPHLQKVFATGQPVVFEDERAGRWLENHIYPILDGAGRVIRLAAYSRDISEQKQTQQALKESEMRLHSISDTIGSLVYAILPDGRISYVNDLAARALGAAPEVIVGQPLSVFFPADDMEKQWGELQAVFENGAPRRGEMLAHFPGGEVWLETWLTPLINSQGKVETVIGSSHNITERKQMEIALRQGEARFRAIIEASPVPYALNDDQGKITYLNAAFTHTFGYTLSDIPTLAEWWPRAYPDPLYRRWVLDTWQAHLERAQQAGQPFEPFEVNIACRDGGQRVVIASAVASAPFDRGEHLVILFDITERKRSETALRQSEEKYRTVANFTYDMETWRGPDGEFIYVSPSCERITGRKAEEFMHNPNLLLEIAHPDDYARLLEHTQLANHDMREQDEQIDFRILTPQGEVRWISHHCQAVFGQDGRWLGRRSSNRDISLRKQIEVELRQERDFANQVMNLMGQGLTVTDASGRFIFVNPAFARLLGRDAGDLLGKKPREVTAPPAQAELARQAQIRRQGQSATYESLILRADGQSAPILISAVPRQRGDQYDGTIAAITDLTEIKRYEEDLRWNQALLASMANSSPLGFYVADNTTDAVLYFNQRFCEIWGLEQHSQRLARGELKHHEVLALCAPQTADPQAFLASFKTLENADHFQVQEDEIAFKSQHTIRRFSTQIRTGQDAYLGCFFIFEDISQRKQAEKEVASLLQEKELLLREVHHRVKNNMNTIASLLSLQSNAEVNDATKTALQDATGRVQSMMVMYDNLYRDQYSSQVSLQVYIPALLQRVIDLFPNRGTIELRTHIEPVFLEPADIPPLGILLNELTTNAMKYAFSGRRSGVIAVEASAQNGAVQIVFRDNGVGMPEIEPNSEPHGFGMQLIHILVKQLDGKVSIERENGTKVSLVFPAHKAK